MSQAIISALKVIVLTRHIREYLELYDPQALKQATEAITAIDPGFATQLAQAREFEPTGYAEHTRRTDELLGRTPRSYTGYGSDGFDINALPTSATVLTEDEDEPEQVICPACNGEGALLGQLGNRLHFRCRQCGMDFSQTAGA